MVINDPVGPADLLSDPGRPLVNATGNFRVERNPLEGVPQHGLVSECSESARASVATEQVRRTAGSLMTIPFALDLHRRGMLDEVVAADHVIITLGPLEGLKVVNPEVP
jgi:hypothetical protein